MSDSREPVNEDRHRQLIESFQDRETREGYAEGFLHTWIASQLATVRQQRGLTQKALAKTIGTKQPGVARMERDDYGKWNLASLARSAAALDCRLKVSIETYGSLVNEILEFTSPEYLQRPDFAHDPVFFPKYSRWKGLDAPGPAGYMRRQMEEWINQGAPIEQLELWLQGRQLPPAGDEVPPSHWLIRGLEGCPPEENQLVVTRVQELLFKLRRRGDELTMPDLELLEFVRARPVPEEYQPLLIEVHDQLRPAWGSRWHASRPDVQRLLLALADNQMATAACRRIWRECITSAEEELEVSVDFGLYGYAAMPSRPNAVEVISEGLEACFERFRGKQRDYYQFTAARLKAMYQLIGDEQFSRYLSQTAVELNVREPNMVAIQHSAEPTAWASTVVPYKDTFYEEAEMVRRLAAVA